MTKLLINENPLIVLPTLAVKVGLNEALILQQVHYWLDPRTNNNIKDSIHWVYNTYAQWHQQFPFFSEMTIRRTITSLEKQSLLISKNYNSNSFSKVKWYTINYEKLKEFEDSIPLKLSNSTKRSARSDHFDQTVRSKRTEDKIKVNSSNTEETETTTKTTTNISLETNNTFKREREMIAIWNKIVEEGRKEVQLTEDRAKALITRFDKFFVGNIMNWQNFCYKIASSKFLMGEVTAFKASLDWSLEPKSIVKIEEGGYGIGDRQNHTNQSDIPSEDILFGIFQESNPEYWKKIQEKLFTNEGKDVYISWFSKLQYVSYENGILELKTPSKFIAQYMEQHHMNKIKLAASIVLKDIKNIKIQC